MPYDTKEIARSCISKYNSKRKNQLILLMITDGKKWHHLAVKKLSAWLRGITSKHVGDLYCLNYFHLYSAKNKLEKHEKVCNDHDYCYVEMPSEDNKILKYNHGEKSIKVPFILYADLECLLEKMHSCQNNPEKSYTVKKQCIHLLLIQCLHMVHLTQQKTNLIVTEAKIVWKRFAKI